MLKNNLQIVEQNISEACKKANRSRDEVTLIAVSKTKPVPQLMEAYNLGIRHFGENKVQELSCKHDLIPQDMNWHMIGHLQRNKVKQVINKVVLIHSVDSFRLAEAIENEAAKQNIIVNILLEVNVAEEDSKFGMKVEDVLPAIYQISKLPHLKIRGLMTIAPFVENPEDNRPIFARLKKLSVDIAAKNIDNVDVSILSMGMTNDYQVAIEEGATMVRVGTGIFGEREYML